MRIAVLAVGTRMPGWVNAAFEDYRGRMPRELRVDLVEIRAERRTAGMPVNRLLEIEATRIQSALPKASLVVVLDQHGRTLDSAAFAAALGSWRDAGRDVAFLIGGADGLASAVKSRADMLLSLSAMTLPHGLARVTLAEQLYRAHTMLSGHPYHRA